MGLADFVKKNENIIVPAAMGYAMGGPEGAMMGGMAGSLLLEARRPSYAQQTPFNARNTKRRVQDWRSSS